ncbi:hypothetical protein TPChic_0487a [Treponema pallidum subsp. pallidum str. Chicago]|nr:hypothetical protein TPChic_0487a [Treponema pallidum subsp. pallidum str. Chicago]
MFPACAAPLRAAQGSARQNARNTVRARYRTGMRTLSARYWF